MSPKNRPIVAALFASILLLAILALAFAASAQTPIPPADLMLPSPDLAGRVAEPWVLEQARSHPWIISILVVIGALRVIVRTVVGMIEAWVRRSPGVEDDARLARVQAATWYRVLGWILDVGASIRLPAPTKPARKTASSGGNLALCLLAFGALGMTGCASFTTHQEETRDEPVGTNIHHTKIVTRAASRTLFSARSSLTRFSAIQTEGRQSATVGSLEQQGATNTVEALKALDSILGKIR